MGMSASQARLLSITSRLTNNEFRAQTITNSKLRLATESQEASQKYMDALNSKQLMFMNYDNNGAASKVELTPAVLYDYAPLKNQYMLSNSAGKVLVNNTEIKNYEKTDNLADFLREYDLIEDVNIEEIIQKEKTEIITEHNPEWDEWKLREPDINEEKYIIPGTEGTHIYKWEYEESDESVSLYEMFEKATSGCFSHATNASGVDSCYVHVLAHMLDLSIDNNFELTGYPKLFEPTVGGYWLYSVEIGAWDITDSWIYQGVDSSEQQIVNSYTPYMVPVSDIIREGYDPGDGSGIQTIMAYDHPASELDLSTAQEWEKIISDYYLPSIDYDQLSREDILKVNLSNYKKDENGIISKKTLRQKCIDMLFVIKNIETLVPDDPSTPEKESVEYYNNIMKPLIRSFQEDMQVSLMGFNIVDKGYDIESTDETINYELYEEDYEKWLNEEPDETINTEQTNVYEEIKKTYYMTVNDRDKAQWYTNLWYKMNGSETANLVTEIEDKDELPEELQKKTLFLVVGTEKNNNGKYYEEYESNLFTSAEWLKFALEHGIVSMEQAQYFNPSEDSLKAKELTSVGYKWSNIVYTSAPDFVQQDNEKAIALAEVKYKKAITEIERKDTKFDQDLKKLDTEHNALQTEYESIKEVLSKNVDRSFKAFS